MSSSPTPSDTIKNMPPGRKQKGLKKVKPPLSETRLSRLIYILICTTILLGAYYSYRFVQQKSEVGGWWSLVLGRSPLGHGHSPGTGTRTGTGGGGGGGGGCSGDSIEDKINDLAETFGIPSNELASAIAVAVRNYVPSNSLSSLVAKETETGEGSVMKIMLKESEERGNGDGSESVKSGSEETESTISHGVVREVMDGFERFVGMDEPV